MKYQDYIWDLGGTLLDNYEISTQTFCKTLADYGLNDVSHDAVYRALRCSTADAVRLFAPHIEGFLETYKKNEAIALKKPILFEGSRQVLSEIVLAGGRNFLWTHRNRQVLDILADAGIAHYFVEVITSDDGFPRKPNPKALLFLKEKYMIERGLVIGDRRIDQEAGHLAGLSTYHFDGVSSLTNILELE